MEILTQKKSRNSFIELYRFLFAMWVVYYHGYFFLPKTHLFSNGYLSVDFFFMLTGFFLMTTFIKLKDYPFWKGVGTLIWKKLKPLGITLIIAVIFAQIYFWLNISTPGSLLGYMWYIEWLIVVPAFYYAIYRWVKNSKKFYIIIGCIVVISYVLLNTVCQGWGVFRGTCGIGIGILISLIPKNKWKIGKFNINVLISILLITFAVVCACFRTYIPNGDHLFILGLFPCLLYFASCTNVNAPVFNYLGGLSFGLYGYQTICRVLETLSILNDKDNCLELFLIIVVLTVLDDAIKSIVRHYKNKRLITNKQKG